MRMTKLVGSRKDRRHKFFKRVNFVRSGDELAQVSTRREDVNFESTHELASIES